MKVSYSGILVTMVWVCVALIALGGWGAQAAASGQRSIMARAKQPRATRGFKNTEMMTARGFGKRGLHNSLLQGTPANNHITFYVQSNP